MTEDKAIIVENLSKIYKLYDSPVDRLKESLHPLRHKYHHDFYALKDVSFQITKGEQVGIIGKNGSGKSTLLKIIAGVLTPTNGSVTVNGRISALLELGAGFNHELTGIENVYFNGMLMGYTRNEMTERLNDILAFAEIGEFAYQPVKTYSSGMFVRLAFSVAVHVEPEILIVDEALSVGDIQFQRKCFSKIESFKKNNLTIIFVTHDVALINNICDTAILMHDGQLIDKSTPRQITQMYNSVMFDNKSNAVESGSYANFISMRNNVNETAQASKLADVGKCDDDIVMELRHGNRKAEIIKYGILDDSGNDVGLITTGHKYNIYFNAIFNDDVIDVFFGIVIRNKHGIELFYTNNELLNIKCTNVLKGQVALISVTVTNYLAKGDYFLTFTVRDKLTFESLDRRLDTLHFKVVSPQNPVGGYVDLNPIMNIQVDTLKGV